MYIYARRALLLQREDVKTKFFNCSEMKRKPMPLIQINNNNDRRKGE